MARLYEHRLRLKIITEPGNYVTRGGEVVKVDEIKNGIGYGSYPNGVTESWDICGRLLPFTESCNDIMSSLPSPVISP